jgi:hypothetical protein
MRQWSKIAALARAALAEQIAEQEARHGLAPKCAEAQELAPPAPEALARLEAYAVAAQTQLGKRRAAAIGMAEDADAEAWLATHTTYETIARWYRAAVPTMETATLEALTLAVMPGPTIRELEREADELARESLVHRYMIEAASKDRTAKDRAPIAVPATKASRARRALLASCHVPKRLDPTVQAIMLSRPVHWLEVGRLQDEAARRRKMLALPIDPQDLPLIDRIAHAVLAAEKARRDAAPTLPPVDAATPARDPRAKVRRWRKRQDALIRMHMAAYAHKIAEAIQCRRDYLLAQTDRLKTKALHRYGLRMAEANAELDAAQAIGREGRQMPKAKGPAMATAPEAIADPYTGDRRHNGQHETLAKGLRIQNGSTARGQLGARDDRTARAGIVRRMVGPRP